MKRIGLLLWVMGLLVTASAQLPYHIVLLGDSNTFLGGDACDKPQGWNKWFKDLAKPKSCRSYARSGATWTHTPQTVYDTKEDVGVLSDNNVIYNQVNRLKEAVETKEQVTPDLVIIMAGTNDLWFADKRPEPIPHFIRMDYGLLAEAFPEARVILVTPPPFNKVSKEKQHQAAEAIAQCGQTLQLDVIRLDEAALLRGNGYFKDGVHTTVKGAKVLGKYIYEQVEAILKK